MLTSAATTLVLGMAATSVLARLLQPADFGLLAMVFALTAIAERFKDIGLGRATVQKKELTHPEVSNLFWLNVAVGCGICLSVSALSGSIARFYHEERLAHVAMLLSTTFIFGGLTIQHQALLTRQMRFLATGTIGTGSVAVSNAVAIVLALKGYGYWSLVWRELVRSVITAAATFACCPWVPGLPKAQINVSSQLRFGRDITIFNIVTYFTSSVDQILLGRFGGATALGLYRQAFQLVMLPVNQITSPLTSVAEPLFSALQDEHAKYKAVFQKTVTLVSLISMPIGAGLFVCAKPIVALLLGPRWAEAVVLVKILAVASFIRPAISTIGFVMITCGKTARYATLGILDSIALATAVSVGVIWGAKGVAVGHVVATYLVFLPFVWWALKDTPVELRTWLRPNARPAICSVTMAAILCGLSGLVSFGSTFGSLAVLVVMGVCCYLGLLYFLPGGKKLLSDLLRDGRSSFSASTLS